MGNLSTDLIETYNAAIARIHAEPDQQDIEITLKALLWITFSREPLQTGTLLHALAIREDNQDINESDLEDIQKVVSLCVGLASIDQKGGEVRLVHETTKEYLQNYFRNERKRDGDEEITKGCLRYFSYPGFSTAFDNKQSLEHHLDRYKLSSYASRYWFVHIQEGNIEERLATVFLDAFGKQDIRDSVFQIAEYIKRPYWFNNYYPAKIHLLHFASMHGLAVPLREILRKTGKVQRL